MYKVPDDQFPEIVKKVRLISTPTCTSCPSVRSFFDRNGIEYEEVHLEDATADELAQIREKNLTTAPIIFVNDVLVAAGGVQYPVLALIKQRRESKEPADVAA